MAIGLSVVPGSPSTDPCCTMLVHTDSTSSNRVPCSRRNAARRLSRMSWKGSTVHDSYTHAASRRGDATRYGLG